MQADSEANNRVKGLSKPEWVLLGLTLGLLICVDIGFTVIQIGEFHPFPLGDWKSALITALVCIALASVKPRSYVEGETVGERVLWAAKYAGFFLTFSMFGSAIFEENAKAIGPMFSIAMNSYIYCSAAWICFAAINLSKSQSSQSKSLAASGLKIIPIFIGSLFLVVAFCVWMALLVVTSETGAHSELAARFMSIKDLPIQVIGKRALAHAVGTTAVCLAVIFGLIFMINTISKGSSISRGSPNILSLGLLVFSLFAVIDIRNTMRAMDDPVFTVANLTSMIILLTFVGLFYAIYLHAFKGLAKFSISSIVSKMPVPLGSLALLFFLFVDLGAQSLVFGIFALLLMLLFVFYLNDLENQILSRTEELREERAKSDALLENMLPGYVIEDLKQRGVSNPKTFPEISVMFTDFVGFTKIAQGMTPEALIDDLNKLFSGYDEIVEAHDSERIKTIGDAYMCASGLSASSSDSTANLIDVAHAMLKFTSEFNRAHGRDWQLRIGIAHGDCVGGVVGEKKYLFDLFGDVVNTAARMESHSEPGRINVDEATFLKASNEGSIEGKKRPLEFVKGKGELQMYFLN